MPLKIYRGGTLNEEGEREQLSQLLEMISDNFDDRHKNTYLVIDPKFPGGSPQIDSLFYREGRIVIFELKNIKGKFKPTTDEGPWKSINADGTEIEIGKQYKNPFLQVKSQRSYLINYISKTIRKRSVSKDKLVWKEIADKIGGWIVTAEGSEPTFKRHPNFFWSKVVPLDNVSKELSFIGTRDDDAITEDEFKELLKQIECIETTKSDAFLNGVVPKYESGRSPVIEDMIDSGKPEEIRKSIKYSRELSFINYFDKYKLIASGLPDVLRGEVFSLLFEWLIKFPEKFKKEDAQQISENGIRDENHRIREQTLYFLLSSKYGIDDELADALVSGLQNERFFSNIQLFVEVLRQINNKTKASSVLKSYYDKHLKEQFFDWSAKSSKLYQQCLSTDDSSFIRNNRDQYREVQEQTSGYSNVVKTWLQAASEINSNELRVICLSHLRQVTTRLQFDPDSEFELPDTLEETIIALGTMEYSEAADVLLEILYKFKSIGVKLRVIEALGKSGSVKVIPELRNFLFGDGEYDPHDAKLLKGQVSMALARLKDSESFDTIWDDFVLESYSESKNNFYLNKLFESLRIMDVKNLEYILWNEVEKHNYSQQSFNIFSDFIKGCASSYTFEKCKGLILDPKLLFNDEYSSPSGILMYSVWKYDDLKERGEKLGLELLKMEDIKLQEIGLSIAETYLLKNPEKLSAYENIESEEGQSIIIEFYVKLKKRDKIEMLFQMSSERDHKYLFYSLERIIPEMHFEHYSVVQNHKVLESEFIVGDLGIYFENNEYKEGVLGHLYFLNVSWNKISYMKKIGLNKKTVGLVFGYEDSRNLDIVLISNSTMNWDYLNGHTPEEFKGLNKLLENFEKTKDVSKKAETCFESGTLFKDIEAVFVNLHTLNGMSKDANIITDEFEKEFKPELVSIV